MIKAGIVGGSGYVSGELMRCLVHHPEVEIDFVYSHSLPGITVATVHPDLLGSIDQAFTDKVNPDVDVVFLSLGHGMAREFLSKHSFSKETAIIDLSQDFRLKATSNLNGYSFSYGLAELNSKPDQNIKYVANPGCFATGIQLGLLPLADKKLLMGDIHIHSITGSTGAGGALKETSHFSWRNNNISIYKPFDHQHLGEIKQSLLALQKDFSGELNFLPVRGDFTRGIFTSMYTNIELDEASLLEIYDSFYADSPFVSVTDQTVHLKQVVNTNNCFIQVQKINDKVLITTIIDNLLKGAAGQAIQNMNLIFGLEETSGLNLKANYF